MHKDDCSVDDKETRNKKDVDGGESKHQQQLGRTQLHVVQGEGFEGSHSILS